MRWKNQRITRIRHKPREPPHPRRRGVHIVRNDVPKEHHCSHIPSLLPLRKKSRAAHLLGCKRPRDGSLSLPIFCGYSPVPSPSEEGWKGQYKPYRLPCVRGAGLAAGQD